MFGGLDVALIMLPVSLRSEELKQRRRRRGRADESKWREKCPYERQLLELRPSLSRGGKGRGWGQEIPLRVVEIEFHTETKIGSPSDASRSTHEEACLQRRRRRPKALTLTGTMSTCCGSSSMVGHR